MKNTTSIYDFIVYDIIKKENDLIEYFCMCQNSGKEKTITNFMIIDIFQDCFLNILNEQLRLNKLSRISLDKFYDDVWERTCDILDIQYSIKSVISNNLLTLDKDLSEIDIEDVLELNIYATGLKVDKKNKCISSDSTYIIYKDLNSEHFSLIEKSIFLEKVSSEVDNLMRYYESQNTNKRTIELNTDAIKSVCLENQIEYKNNLNTNTCKHKFLFNHKHNEDLMFGSGIYQYSFKCAHCGEIKYILNYDIINSINNSILSTLRTQVNLPKENRMFNFQIFDLAWEKFFKEENIDKNFRKVFYQSNTEHSLNKELVLINEDDTDITFTSSVGVETGLFSKSIVNKQYILTKKEQLDFV